VAGNAGANPFAETEKSDDEEEAGKELDDDDAGNVYLTEGSVSGPTVTGTPQQQLPNMQSPDSRI